MLARITVTISGVQGMGKTIVAEIIQDALQVAGVEVRHDPKQGSYRPRPLDQLWDDALRIQTAVQIVEKQDSK